MPRKKPSAPVPVQSSSAQSLPGGGYIHKYGVRSKSRPLEPLEVELAAASGRVPAPEGKGTYRHYRNAIDMIWPGTKWNSFMERQVESFAENHWNAWVGMAASGKTHVSICCALVWWLMDPKHTTIVLTSTTGKMIRKRAWPIVRSLYHDCNGVFPGNMVDSKTILQAVKGDDKHGIFAMPVAQGPVETAVGEIKGIHSSRMLIIIDEAEETPAGIFGALPNLYVGTTEFRVLLLFNPESRLSAVGQMCEPADGWGSVTMDDQSWETKPQLNGKPMMVNRFDCEQSPNVLAGQTLFTFLVTQQQVEGAKRSYGENHPYYWKNYRGWWPPDGLIKTIFSSSLIIQKDGRGRHTFLKILFRVAGFDPAFGGGDRPMLQFAECGMLEEGRTAIQLTDRIKLNINALSPNDIHYQLAEQLRRECEARDVPPENVAIDETGEGGGLCNIISRTWSPNIIRVCFGGSASDRPISKDDVRICSKVYSNKVCELWHQARLYLLDGLLKGLDAVVSKEFCNRTFDDSKKDKITLQTKAEMKLSMKLSPDNADAVVLVIEAARKHGASSQAGAVETEGKDSGWLAKARQFDKVNQTDADYERAQRGGYYGSFIVTANG